MGVAADHGEGLGDHGYLRHGLMVDKEAGRVPLLFRFCSRVPAGIEILPIADLEPTIVDFALGVERREGLQGEIWVLEGRARADPESRCGSSSSSTPGPSSTTRKRKPPGCSSDAISQS